MKQESQELVYRKGFKYQVKRFLMQTPFIGYSWDTNYYSMDEDGMLEIKDLYAYDGPSGPALDTEDTMIPSLGHDALCQAMNEGLLPRECHKAVDEFFKLTGWRAGMLKLWRAYFYLAVRLNAKFKLVGPEKEHRVSYKHPSSSPYWIKKIKQIQTKHPSCLKASE